jgi:hypothetical protein
MIGRSVMITIADRDHVAELCGLHHDQHDDHPLLGRRCVTM